MQFVPNGPNIPEALLHAHEQGRVVFFCGAGISYPAGLPSFKGLVQEIYKDLYSTDKIHEKLTDYGIVSEKEQRSYDDKSYDATLDSLERNHSGHRNAVRKALMKSLTPKFRNKGATNTHRALLKLSQSRSSGKLRLVTTNFDRIFERVLEREEKKYRSYRAPHLPLPQTEQWDGIVYLHGLLPKTYDVIELEELIVTSGDFGRAYLTEGWAARFVTELFRNYIVCFVGYSIDDPILRYMMDALAADKLRGEKTTRAFAFAELSLKNKGGDEEEKALESKKTEWNAKGVEPILYKVIDGSNDHSLLHGTLHEWASACEIDGKENIIRECAYLKPSQSTQEDNFVGRVLWAISDPSGAPAKLFANLNPVPSIEWLREFSKKYFTKADLAHFGVAADETIEPDLSFSLLARPCPYKKSEFMSLVSQDHTSGKLDKVMHHLSAWLTRHINTPELILWISDQGGVLNERFAYRISSELSKLSNLKNNNKAKDLESNKKKEPNETPSKRMMTIWHIILNGHAGQTSMSKMINIWEPLTKSNKLTQIDCLGLLHLLSPKIKFSEAFGSMYLKKSKSPDQDPSESISHELVLGAKDAIHFFSRKEPTPALIETFQQTLKSTLEILAELEKENDDPAGANFSMVSIAEHPQNYTFSDCAILIGLLRDSWKALHNENQERAKEIACRWIESSYIIFKRLALFSANQDWEIEPPNWVDWLLAEEAQLLWSSESKRESIRLIVEKAGKLPIKQLRKLESTIIKGSTRLAEKLNRQDDVDRNKYYIWFRLAKLSSGSAKLGNRAESKLSKLSADHPDWRLKDDQSDEFRHWSSSIEDIRDFPEYARERFSSNLPELISQLKNPKELANSDSGKTWEEICKQYPDLAINALDSLGKDGYWLEDRWQKGFSTWSTEVTLTPECIYKLLNSILQFPRDTFSKIEISLGFLLGKISRSDFLDDKGLLEISNRMLDTYESAQDKKSHETEYKRSPINNAINHPVGHVTEAVLNIWYKRKPNDNVPIPSDIEPFFTRICNKGSPLFIHGRVLLASHAISLFRADKVWATNKLLPYADWRKSSEEAIHFWAGFLWSPRIYPPLMEYLKEEIIETARHYTELNEVSKSFADFITYAALSPTAEFDSKDYALAFCALPIHGLECAVHTLVRVLKNQEKSAAIFWQDKILPFWRKVWPKSGDKKTVRISESLVDLAVASKEKYPDAVREIINSIASLDFPDHTISLIDKADLFEKFPTASLALLNALIADPEYTPDGLAGALAKIEKARPKIKGEDRYKRLLRISKRT